MPEEIPAGKVKLAIIYELPRQDESKKTLKSLQTFMANYKDVDVDTGIFDAQRKWWQNETSCYEFSLFTGYQHYFRTAKSPTAQIVTEKIECHAAQIAIPAIVVYELIRGASLLPESQKRSKIFDYIESVLVDFPVLSYTQTIVGPEIRTIV